MFDITRRALQFSHATVNAHANFINILCLLAYFNFRACTFVAFRPRRAMDKIRVGF